MRRFVGTVSFVDFGGLAVPEDLGDPVGPGISLVDLGDLERTS